MAGPDRKFEIRVPDVQEASSFYRQVLGARETFRQEADNGELLRLGLDVGKIGFVISSEDIEGVDAPLLSLLAAEFGEPYIAIILQAEDADRMALLAMKNGAELMETPSEYVTVVTDPFGSHWAFVKSEAAADPLLSQAGRSNNGIPFQ